MCPLASTYLSVIEIQAVSASIMASVNLIKAMGKVVVIMVLLSEISCISVRVFTQMKTPSISFSVV
jgi:hypothetical protein